MYFITQDMEKYIKKLEKYVKRKQNDEIKVLDIAPLFVEKKINEAILLGELFE